MAFAFLGAIAMIAFQICVITKVMPWLGHTEERYELADAATFRVKKKQMLCMHLQIWLMVGCFIAGILFLQVGDAPILQVLREWRHFLLFILCFFLAIDLLLHAILVGSYLSISTEAISYRFGFKRYYLPVEQMDSIANTEGSYRVCMKSGVCQEIPSDGFYLLGDSDHARDLLEELSNVVNKLA